MPGGHIRVPVMVMPGPIFHPIPAVMSLVLGAAKDEFRGRGRGEKSACDKRDG